MANGVALTPTYYHLHYSMDPTVRQRRIQKFFASHSGKALLSHHWWDDPESLSASATEIRVAGRGIVLLLPHQALLKKKNAEVRKIISFFDEIILRFDASETSISGHLETFYDSRHKTRGLVKFEKPFDENLFLPRLPIWLREQLSFQPAGLVLTCKKIFETGEKIQSRFPEIKFRPLPGLDQWDPRIPEDVELIVCGERKILHQTSNPDLKISVIIPTYDNRDYLLNCLRHLISQTLDRRQFEIIVVDDGSPSQDLSELEAFLGPEAGRLNFQYYYIPKKVRPDAAFGQFRAGQCRNFGVMQARSPNLSFLDSDMIVPRDYLEKVQNALLKADLVQFVRHHIKPAHSTRFTNYHDTSQKNLFIEEAQYWKPFFECHHWMDVPDFWKYTCTYSLSMTRTSFDSWGGFRKTYVSYGFEDTDFGYSAAQTGARFALEKTPLYHLTPFADKSRYRHSLMYKHQLLRLTAKTFYLNHLSPDIYQKFNFFLQK